MINVKNLIFAAILLFGYYFTTFAQKLEGYEMDINLCSSDVEDKVSYSITGKYIYLINPYLGLICGLAVKHTEIEKTFYSEKEHNVIYNIKDNIINVNGLIGIKSSTPTMYNIGLMADGSFLFEPIPVNTTSINKEFIDNKGIIYKVENKNSIIYTHFNPAINIQTGFFYDIKNKDSEILRIAIGLGLDSQNPYNTYNHTVIDNLKIRDYIKLKPNKNTISYFFRLSFIYN